MSRSRARSSSQASSQRKPTMFTKYKERTGNRSVLDDPGYASQQRFHSRSSHLEYPKRSSKSFLWRSNQNKFPMDESFLNTSRELQKHNFIHHDPNVCVCEHCLCGRHLCKMHQVKPDLSKNSIYQKDFFKKCPVENKVNISKEYDRLQGPNLEINSIYLKDYAGDKGDNIERPTPEDLLKTGGPGQKLTSYSSGFPGYRCNNQYVKPTNLHTRGRFPLSSKTTYSKSFIGEPGKKDDYDGIPDNLKTGYNWFGKTTYGTRFLKPNPENYPAHFRRNEKLEQNPNYKRQYETTYRNDFLGERKEVCPAKTILETKNKGAFTNSKAKFSENTDFKAMSPEFHAISTSKHCYV